MSEETKEAVRLLIECADELRHIDMTTDVKVDAQLKLKLMEYFTCQGLLNAEYAADLLCTSSEDKK